MINICIYATIIGAVTVSCAVYYTMPVVTVIFLFLSGLMAGWLFLGVDKDFESQ